MSKAKRQKIAVYLMKNLSYCELVLSFLEMASDPLLLLSLVLYLLLLILSTI